MKDQYGSKRGEQVFYASMNKGKIKGVEKKKIGGMAGKKSGPPPKKGPASQGVTLKSGIKVLKAKGGMDASQADFGGGTPGPGDTGGAGGYGKGTSQFGQKGSSPTSTGGGRNNKTNTVTARPGPTRVPVIGPTTYLANKFLEARYNRKNLQEQRKEDVLGGEMLTQGKRTTPTPIGGGGDGGQRPIQLAQTKVASTSTVPIPLMKVKPKTFDFEYKDGGLVRGSGKILKDRVKKARIY